MNCGCGCCARWQAEREEMLARLRHKGTEIIFRLLSDPDLVNDGRQVRRSYVDVELPEGDA